TATPPANAAGWWTAAVTITFQCSDAGSGIASCPAPIVVSTDGANQTFTGTAADRAGNQATATISISIDASAPTITAAAAPPPNAVGWNNTDVTVTFTCADTLSG